MWYLQAQYLHHKQEKSPFPSQGLLNSSGSHLSTAQYSFSIILLPNLHHLSNVRYRITILEAKCVLVFFPIYFILFFNLVCFLEFSLCHQHIHYAFPPTYSLCFWKAIQLCNWLKVETEDNVHVYLQLHQVTSKLYLQSILFYGLNHWS